MGKHAGQPPQGSAFERLSQRQHFDVLGRKCVPRARNSRHASCCANTLRRQSERPLHEPGAQPQRRHRQTQAHAAAGVPPGTCACVRRAQRGGGCSRPTQNGKAGGFIDRRFGESDPNMDVDEKALRRMQRLRQMQFGRASRFALGGAPPRPAAKSAHSRPERRRGRGGPSDTPRDVAGCW